MLNSCYSRSLPTLIFSILPNWNAGPKCLKHSTDQTASAERDTVNILFRRFYVSVLMNGPKPEKLTNSLSVDDTGPAEIFLHFLLYNCLK